MLIIDLMFKTFQTHTVVHFSSNSKQYENNDVTINAIMRSVSEKDSENQNMLYVFYTNIHGNTLKN